MCHIDSSLSLVTTKETSMIERITPDNEQHWLGMRKQDLTSTETAALFGLSPYMTEFELWHRKRSGETPEFPDNFRMRAGRALESGIAQLTGMELNAAIKPLKDYMRDPYARLGSSFDYEVAEGEYAGWLIECKNVDQWVYRDNWTEDEAPDHIEVQVQHQLEIAERPGAIIAALVGGNSLHLIFRERNPKVGAGIRKKASEFWRSIEAGVEPTPNYEMDADVIIELHPGGGAGTIEADEQLSDFMARYKKWKAEAKKADDEAKKLKAKMLDLIGDDISKVVAEDLTLNCGRTKDTEPTLITADMVGTTYGGRKGYRQFTIREKK
jgi:putative phage-type endonuclease